MRIYLGSKYIMVLLLPFLLLGILYIFQSDIKDQLRMYILDNTYIATDYKFDEKKARKYYELDKALSRFRDLSKKDMDDIETALNIFSPSTQNHNVAKLDIKRRWILKYVIISGKKRVALINGKIVKIGQMVDGAILLDVTRDRIKLKTKEGIKWINLVK